MLMKSSTFNLLDTYNCNTNINENANIVTLFQCVIKSSQRYNYRLLPFYSTNHKYLHCNLATMRYLCCIILLLLGLVSLLSALNVPFWGKSAANAPSINTKKTIIITGANSGIGFASAKQILTEGNDNYRVIFAGRSKERTLKAIQSLPASAQANAEFQLLDLNDLQSVRSFCDQFVASKQGLHALALNAGVQSGPSKIPPVTAQGYEETVGTNHLGHFLLLQRLLPVLERTQKSERGASASRIVITASGVHNPAEGGGNVGKPASLGDLSGFQQGFQSPAFPMVDGQLPYDSDKSYKDSKLLNVITTLELHRRLVSKRLTNSITVNCFNPGLAPTTGLFRKYSPLFVLPFTFLTRTVFKVAVSEAEAGARLTYLLTDASVEGVSGQYFTGKPGKAEFVAASPSEEAQDPDKAKKVWSLSEKLVAAFNK